MNSDNYKKWCTDRDDYISSWRCSLIVVWIIILLFGIMANIYFRLFVLLLPISAALFLLMTFFMIVLFYFWSRWYKQQEPTDDILQCYIPHIEGPNCTNACYGWCVHKSSN